MKESGNERREGEEARFSDEKTCLVISALIFVVQRSQTLSRPLVLQKIKKLSPRYRKLQNLRVRASSERRRRIET